jgi:hypothetical protein
MADTADPVSTDYDTIERLAADMTVDRLIAYKCSAKCDAPHYCARSLVNKLICFPNAVNYGGRVHVFDNRNILLPRCYYARRCLFCGLYDTVIPYAGDGVFKAQHDWTEPRPAFSCPRHGRCTFEWKNDLCCAGDVTPKRVTAMQCRDCGVFWVYEKTHSKQKLP